MLNIGLNIFTTPYLVLILLTVEKEKKIERNIIMYDQGMANARNKNIASCLV